MPPNVITQNGEDVTVSLQIPICKSLANASNY